MLSAAAAVVAALAGGCDAPAPGLYASADLARNLAPAGGGITLARGVLIEDDGPAFGPFDPAAEPGSPLRRNAAGPADTPYWEPITRAVRARKTLVIEALTSRPGARATLLFFAAAPGPPTTPPQGELPAEPPAAWPPPLVVEVNGSPVVFDPTDGGRSPAPPAGQMRWWSLPIDAALLTAGRNEIVLRTDSDLASWKVLIAPAQLYGQGSTTRRCPGRSARSTDAGANWSAQLGADGSAQGEYCVRLALDQHLLSGEWVSGVYDTVGLADDGPVRRHMDVSAASGRVSQSAPEGGRVRWEARGGLTQTYSRFFWGRWTKFEPDAQGRFKLPKPGGRFVQFRALLTTEDPTFAPTVRSVRVSADKWKAAPVPPGQIRVLELRNPRIVAGGGPWDQEPMPHSRLGQFGRRFNLEPATRNSRTQFDQVLRTLKWLSSRRPDRLFIPGAKWDSVDILGTRAVAPGRPLAAQIVLIQALHSQGLIGRLVTFAGATDSFQASEFWSDDYGKWVLLDGWGCRCFVDSASGEPLGAVELHERFLAAGVRWEGGPAAQADRPTADRLGLRTMNWAGCGSAGERLTPWPAGALLLMPRNDFLAHPSPLPPSPGYLAPGWTGYLLWAGTPGERPAAWFSRRADRAADFNWSCNQVQMEIEHGAKSGTLRVLVHTVTPAFDTFLVSANEEEFRPLKANELTWDLVAGPNCLRVRARNRGGAHGPISLLRVHYAPPGT